MAAVVPELSNSGLYVPILKAKRAELDALAELASSVNDGLVPLIEVRADLDVDDRLPRIHRARGRKRPFYVDIVPPPGVRRMAGLASEQLRQVSGYVARAGLHLVPVTGLGRTTGYQQAVRDVARRDGNGVLIRLHVDYLRDTADVAEELAQVTATLGVTRATTDILLDLGPISTSAASAVETTAREVLARLPCPREWRSLVMASTAFPASLAAVHPPDEVSISERQIDRTDWAIWQAIIGNPQGLERWPAFSDYCVQHPYEPDPAPKGGLPRVPNLRYATETGWLVLRGRDLRRHDTPTFGALCSRLVSRSDEFMGPGFSEGDTYIAACAADLKCAPRAFEDWRRPAVVHHLTLVVRQLAGQVVRRRPDALDITPA